MTRTFIAFTVPQSLNTEVVDIVKLVALKIPKETKASFENFDKSLIILSHLGRLDKEKLEMALDIAKNSADSLTSFEISFSGIGYIFKTKKWSESVVYIDLDDKKKSMKYFYKTLFRELSNAGFYPAKRVEPLINIARVKQMRKPAEQQKMLSEISEIELPNYPKFIISSLDVYESLEHYGTATTYKLIKQFPFKNLSGSRKT